MGHVASSAAISISFTIRTRRMGSCAVLKRGVFSQPSDSPSARGGWGLEDVGKDKAFRHQRMNHHRVYVHSGRSVNVLNAFRHQRMNHSTHPASPHPASPVLNAFRHQRMNHVPDTADIVRTFQVLNAFRHQRMNHSALPSSAYTGDCAQRLSASTNESPSDPKFCWAVQQCSTPFGINE